MLLSLDGSAERLRPLMRLACGDGATRRIDFDGGHCLFVGEERQGRGLLIIRSVMDRVTAGRRRAAPGAGPAGHGYLRDVDSVTARPLALALRALASHARIEDASSVGVDMRPLAPALADRLSRLIGSTPTPLIASTDPGPFAVSGVVSGSLANLLRALAATLELEGVVDRRTRRSGDARAVATREGSDTGATPSSPRVVICPGAPGRTAQAWRALGLEPRPARGERVDRETAPLWFLDASPAAVRAAVARATGAMLARGDAVAVAGLSLRAEAKLLHDVRGADLQSARVETGAGSLTMLRRRDGSTSQTDRRAPDDAAWDLLGPGLIYLPPTMASARPVGEGPWLEHVSEAFAYYERRGHASVDVQKKHMGSRASVLLCRDQSSARSFGLGARLGAVHTRWGNRFFADPELEAALVADLRAAADRADAWRRHRTEWMCLDGEILPWSFKAGPLAARRYERFVRSHAVEIAGLHARIPAMATTDGRQSTLLESLAREAAELRQFEATWRSYCWPVHGVQDLGFAPFHWLAATGRTHVTQNHEWHVRTLERIFGSAACFRETPWRRVHLRDAANRRAIARWYERLVDEGAEGVVVKPLHFVEAGRRGQSQPALKVRGPRHLALVYGPDYAREETLLRLRDRGPSPDRRRKHRRAVQQAHLGQRALDAAIAGASPAAVQHLLLALLQT